MYQQQHYPHQPQRSAIPKVIGILMIIFASLGLLGSLIGLAGGGNREMFRAIPELKTWATIELLLNVIGLAYGAFHLYAGVRCLGYKSNAPKLAVVYGVVAIAMVLINLILVFAWVKPALDGMMGDLGPGFGAIFGVAMIFGSLIGIAWPTIVMILMTRPSAKAACVNDL